MLINQRIFWDNGTTLKDLSVNLNNIANGSEIIPLVSTTDYIYIGSDMPFNHRYFESLVSNDQLSTVSVEIWGGNNWNPAVDVIDQTSLTGAPFEQSGVMSWTTDRNKSWGIESTTENIPELSTLNIYDFYWIRISFSANFLAATSLSYVGHKFSDDSDLEIKYPDLINSKVLSAFKSGKTNWNEQHVKSAEDIVRYLRKKREAWSANQVFNWDQFNDAAVHRTAFLIMMPFGEDYDDERKAAEKEYFRALNMGNFQIDRNQDGKLERQERVEPTGWVRR